MKAGGLLLVLGLALHAAAWAQAPPSPQLPQTADGHPDFQGIWSSQWVTPLERESADMPLVLSQQEAAALEVRVRAGQTRPLQFCFDIANWEGPILQVRGEYRSSLIIEPSANLSDARRRERSRNKGRGALLGPRRVAVPWRMGAGAEAI